MGRTSFLFGGFELHPAARELRAGDEVVHLPPRAFSVLRHLVEQRERLCSERELLESCWPGERVTRSSLTQAVRKARLALGDDPAAPRFIATAQRGGYRFIHPVVERAPASGTGPRLVGRGAEQARLRAGLGAAIAGEKRVFLLLGEAGAGKSTLARALCDEARAQGVSVGIGVCPGDDAAPPFWPWRSALEALVSDAGAPPELKAPLDTAHDESVWRGSLASRLRVYDGVSRRLREASRERPIVLVLEDFHWAHPSCQELLRFVARAPSDARLLVVCTLRPDEAPARLTRLLDEGGVEGLHLPAFGLPEVEALCAAAGAADVDARELLHRSGGNPFFTVELLRARGGDGGDVPLHAVRDVIARRLARLPPETARALELAAVLGERFEPALLRACAEGTAQEVDAALERAQVAGLLRDDGARDLAFRHALVREVAYGRIAPARRAALHASVAEALARLGGGDRRARAAALAHHAVQGASARNARAAIAFATAAADAALSQVAHAEAALHFGQALDAARFASDFSAHERAALLLRRADAQRWAGERPGAVETLHEVHGIGRALADGKIVAAAAIGLGVVVYVDAIGARPDAALALVDDALACAPDDAAMRARLFARKAILVHWSGDGADGGPFAQEALTLAEASGQESTRAHARFADFVTRLRPAFDGDRLARAEGILALARAAREPEVEVAASLCVFHEAVSIGAAARIERARLDAEETLAHHGHPMAGSLLPAFCAQIDGTADAVDARVTTLAERMRAADNPNARTILAAHALARGTVSGRLAHARPLFEEGMRHHGRIAAWAPIFALVALEEGREDEARRHYARALDDPRLSAGTDLQWLATMDLLAHLVARFGDRAAAARLYPAVLPHASRNVTWGYPAAFVGPAAVTLGRLAATAGDDAAAAAHFESAVAQTRALGATRALIEALLAAGEHLGRADAPTRAPVRAAVLLREAADRATRAGYGELAAMAARGAALG